MQTSSGAAASASWRNVAISSSLRASSERPTIRPPAPSTSATSGASLSPCRRPAKTVKPSDANFLAMAPPIKSPAPITAAVAFLCSNGASCLSSNGFLCLIYCLFASDLGQAMLQDLAGRTGRQGVKHDDLARPLVRSELSGGMCRQIRRVDGRARRQLYEGHDFLVARNGAPDHC